MAPERPMGEPVTEACDIYAIGVILCELVTGRRPCDAELVSTLREGLVWRARVRRLGRLAARRW